MQQTPQQTMDEQCLKHYRLGATKQEIYIASTEENKNAAICLTKQARYSIDIFTQDLNADIYNNKEIEHAIFELAKRHPSTRIRILLQDSANAIQNGHRLIRLAHNLTSSIFIHNPSDEHKDKQCGFLVVDKLGLLHRLRTTDKNYKASVNFMSNHRAGKLCYFFNEAWEHSTPDVQTRRLYV